MATPKLLIAIFMLINLLVFSACSNDYKPSSYDTNSPLQSHEFINNVAKEVWRSTVIGEAYIFRADGTAIWIQTILGVWKIIDEGRWEVPEQGLISLRWSETSRSGIWGYTISQDTLVFDRPWSSFVRTSGVAVVGIDEIMNYTITFNSQAGSHAKPITQNGGYITLPTTERLGFDFVGWFTAPLFIGGEKVGVAGDRHLLDSHITVYAHWTTPTSPQFDERLINKGSVWRNLRMAEAWIFRADGTFYFVSFTTDTTWVEQFRGTWHTVDNTYIVLTQYGGWGPHPFLYTIDADGTLQIPQISSFTYQRKYIDHEN